MTWSSGGSASSDCQECHYVAKTTRAEINEICVRVPKSIHQLVTAAILDSRAGQVLWHFNSIKGPFAGLMVGMEGAFASFLEVICGSG